MFSIQANASTTKSYALHLKPGSDLRQSIANFVKEKKLKAAAITTCVGSLTKASIRYVDAKTATEIKGPFEIVSLVGTASIEGEHLHISISDSNGKTIGGHLAEGNIVYTTAEIVLTELEQLEFTRVTDPQTTYKELQIQERTKK